MGGVGRGIAYKIILDVGSDADGLHLCFSMIWAAVRLLSSLSSSCPVSYRKRWCRNNVMDSSTSSGHGFWRESTNMSAGVLRTVDSGYTVRIQRQGKGAPESPIYPLFLKRWNKM